jgi:sigma-B regulation protein RsbU (phosphoserine phosphatase)
MVMGIVPEIRYQNCEVALEPGELLALFSDGVTESRTADKMEEFGEQRLAEFLAGHLGDPPRDAIDRLVAHLRSWSGQDSFADDFTMLLVKRLS